MRVLIDGDIVTYRASCSSEQEESWIACVRADKTIEEILVATEATEYTIFLTGTGNFRRELSPDYKANRPETRPAHWAVVRQYLINNHNTVVCDGKEADDELGIQQDKETGTTILCSIDKDLRQIPGRHYNFVKKEFFEVTKCDGKKFLYLQALIGDRNDNIFGVHGIGPKKADRAFEGLTTELEWYNKCLELYDSPERLHLNLKLLYIHQKPNDSWEVPHGNKD